MAKNARLPAAPDVELTITIGCAEEIAVASSETLGDCCDLRRTGMGFARGWGIGNGPDKPLTVADEPWCARPWRGVRLSATAQDVSTLRWQDPGTSACCASG
jgi:hypothetical protein